MDMSTAAPGYSRQQWNAHSKPERITAALLAIVITLAIPGLLHERNHGDNFGTANTVLNVRLIPSDSNPSATTTSHITYRPPQPTKPRDTRTAAKSPAQQTPLAKTGPTLAVSSTTPTTATPTTITTTTETPKLSSMPLQIDSKAIRKAYQDSKSEIEKLDERSGKLINDRPITKYDRFESAVSQAAKPECISKDTAGAGLLAIPLIAYWVVTDKCK
jgi:hypothetical protein